MLADAVPPDIWGNVGSTAIAATPSLLIGGATALYLLGARRVARLHPDEPWSRSRSAAFVGAMALTFVAIELFLGVYDDVLFYDHMIQHLVLIMLAAPLIAMSAPLELLRSATAGRAHQLVARALDSEAAGVLGHPLVGFLLYTVLIPLAHLTPLYGYSLTHDLAHDNEHLAFLVVGYLFWRPVVAIEPSRHRLHPGIRLVYLMLAVPIDTFCGLVLVSTNHEMFPYYGTFTRTWGPSLVGDLHLGGAIMWIGGDSLMALAMIPVAVALVRYEERRAALVDAELDAMAASSSSTPTS